MSLKEKKKQIVKKVGDSATLVETTKKVYYHNTIARMNNKFSLEEEKALHIIFSNIKPFLFENATTIQIEKKQFFKQLGLVGDDKYKRYEKLMNDLVFKSFIKIETESFINNGVVLSGSKDTKKRIILKLN